MMLVQSLGRHRKGDIVVIFVKVIMERERCQPSHVPPVFSHILEHEDVSIVPVGIHEVSVEVGDVELIRGSCQLLRKVKYKPLVHLLSNNLTTSQQFTKFKHGIGCWDMRHAYNLGSQWS